MPRHEGVMLSAGCADAYYFHWIAENYGEVAEHIGIELYQPEPPGLPSNVRWVKNSVGDMSGVGAASVDIVFSGQNFEHLFGDDAVHFLLESHRVLRPGGALVIDSPQRSITRELKWAHPEHTIEFDAHEATESVRLAGFDVTDVRGLWLCRDIRTGELLPRWPEPSTPEEWTEILMRVALASQRPEESFVWWLEAEKADRGPDLDGLRKRFAELYELGWEDRRSRLQNQVGTLEDGIVSVGAGESGAAVFGPLMPIEAGEYTVVFQMRRISETEETHVARVDVIGKSADSGEEATLAERDVSASELPVGEWRDVSLPLEVAALHWAGQFRVWSTGAAAIDVRLRFDLAPRD